MAGGPAASCPLDASAAVASWVLILTGSTRYLTRYLSELPNNQSSRTVPPASPSARASSAT